MNSPSLDVSRPPSKATQYIGCLGFVLFFSGACVGVYELFTSSQALPKHYLAQELGLFFCSFVILFACFRGDQSPIGKFIAKVGEIGSLFFFIRLLTMATNRRNSSDHAFDKTS